MDFGLMAKAIQNKKFILVYRFEVKKDNFTVGDWHKMSDKQREKYKKQENEK
jgi:hypothetical protein